MPLVKAQDKMIYYAHVPKCGGTSIEDYLRSRFGHVAFLNNDFAKIPEAERWSRTSPQHVTAAVLSQMFPAGFFDASFGIVRHPVSRIVSAYHFQVAVAWTASSALPFSDWLRHMAEAQKTNPYPIDNHFRPQVDFLPDGCTVFHLEHGLDPVIPYLDAVTGTRDGPRFIAHKNKRRDPGAAAVTPGAEDLRLIRDLFAADFDRFGYEPGTPGPAAPRPDLDADFLAQASAERARANRLVNRLAAKIRRKVLG